MAILDGCCVENYMLLEWYKVQNLFVWYTFDGNIYNLSPFSWQVDTPLSTYMDFGEKQFAVIGLLDTHFKSIRTHFWMVIFPQCMKRGTIERSIWRRTFMNPSSRHAIYVNRLQCNLFKIQCFFFPFQSWKHFSIEKWFCSILSTTRQRDTTAKPFVWFDS